MSITFALLAMLLCSLFNEGSKIHFDPALASKLWFLSAAVSGITVLYGQIFVGVVITSILEVCARAITTRFLLLLTFARIRCLNQEYPVHVNLYVCIHGIAALALAISASVLNSSQLRLAYVCIDVSIYGVVFLSRVISKRGDILKSEIMRFPDIVRLVISVIATDLLFIGACITTAYGFPIYYSELFAARIVFYEILNSVKLNNALAMLQNISTDSTLE